MKSKRLLQRRSLGWFVAVCMFFTLASSIIGANAAENYTLTLEIENETEPGDLDCGTLALTIDGNSVETDDGSEVYYGNVTVGDTLVVTATAKPGYTVYWEMYDVDSSEVEGQTVRFDMPDRDVIVTAIFVKDLETPEETELYQLEYEQVLTLPVNNKYPVEDLSLSLAELSELLGIKLVGDAGSEIDCEIASSDNYSAELFDELGNYTVTFRVIFNEESYTGSVELEIVDLKPPVIDSIPELYLELENEAAAPKTIEALGALFAASGLDNYDGVVELIYEIEECAFEDIDWTVEGVYTVVIYAEDASSNSVEQLVTLYIDIAPAVEDVDDVEDEEDNDEQPSGGGVGGDGGFFIGGRPGGNNESKPEEEVEILDTDVPEGDGGWDEQNPSEEPAETVAEEDDGEWTAIPAEEVPAGDFTSLPQTGSMMVQVMMLLGLALVGTGALLRKKH